MTREEAISILSREIDEDPFLRTEYREQIHEALKMAIKTLAQEPKTGYWIGEKAYPICSKCNCNFMEEYIAYADYAEIYKPMNFCPNCGVKMIDPQDSEVQE